MGLLIFTDQVKLFIPPRKGTDIKLALDTINQIVKNRSILFMISDFLEDRHIIARHSP